MIRKSVDVLPYNQNWPLRFKEAAEKIKLALGSNCEAVYHVGSTSVPGLASKNKIDICLKVKDAKAAIICLEKIDFEYRGEWNIPFKYGFRYRQEIKSNLHMFDFDHPAMESNLRFRDFLRNNEDARDEYANLKYEILKDETSHIKDHPLFPNYTLRKSAFIKTIIEKTGFDKIYMQFCADQEEFSAAREFRKGCFLRQNNMEDPYVWTFDDKDHKHLVLYKGVKIVGYAHVQLWPEHRATIRIIVIDEEHRGKDYGKEFITLIEKWLRLRGYKSVHTESSPSALGFYKCLNYEPMPFNDPDHYEGSP